MNENKWKIAFVALLAFVIGFLVCSFLAGGLAEEYYRDGYMAATYKVPPKYSVNGINGWSKHEKQPN